MPIIKTVTNMGKDVEKLELIHYYRKCKIVLSLWKTVWQFFK